MSKFLDHSLTQLTTDARIVQGSESGRYEVVCGCGESFWIGVDDYSLDHRCQCGKVYRLVQTISVVEVRR